MSRPTNYKPRKRLVLSCLECGKPFESTRPDSVTCGPRCRKARSRRLGERREWDKVQSLFIRKDVELPGLTLPERGQLGKAPVAAAVSTTEGDWCKCGSCDHWFLLFDAEKMRGRVRTRCPRCDKPITLPENSRARAAVDARGKGASPAPMKQSKRRCR